MYHIVLLVKSPGKSNIFLIVAEIEECSNSELLNGFYDSGGLLTNFSQTLKILNHK